MGASSPSPFTVEGAERCCYGIWATNAALTWHLCDDRLGYQLRRRVLLALGDHLPRWQPPSEICGSDGRDYVLNLSTLSRRSHRSRSGVPERELPCLAMPAGTCPVSAARGWPREHWSSVLSGRRRLQRFGTPPTGDSHRADLSLINVTVCRGNGECLKAQGSLYSVGPGWFRLSVTIVLYGSYSS